MTPGRIIMIVAIAFGVLTILAFLFILLTVPAI
jgi:hypothetical protein